jgi:hypothetical protein
MLSLGLDACTTSTTMSITLVRIMYSLIIISVCIGVHLILNIYSELKKRKK